MDLRRHVRENRRARAIRSGGRAPLHAEDSRLRNGYVRQFIERIAVDNTMITVRGSQAAHAYGLIDPAAPGAAGAPGFVPEWWTK